jgi:type IV pilus assembly protein PilO
MAAASKDASFSSLPLAGKLFILALLLVVVSAIYYFAFHMQLSDEIEGAHAQYAQLQQEQRQAEQRQQQYLRLAQELAGREALDRANKRVLPERAEIAAFLQDLNRIAELSGLQIASVQPRPEIAEQYFTKIPVKLRFVGSFHQLAKFFYNVGHLERIISMENIELTHPRIVDGQVLLDVDVMATTYRQPEGAEPAAEER